MLKNNSFEKYIINRHIAYSKYPILDIVYYALKGYGMFYSDSENSKPKVHIADDKNLFSIVPLMSSEESYVSADDPEQLQRLAVALEFKVKFYPRIKSKKSYFYLRCDEEEVQTLGCKKILNTNFNPRCNGCEFCSRGYDGYDSRNYPSISIDQGFLMLHEAKINFFDLSEIAIVTGIFPSESKLVKHIVDMIKMAAEKGFSGDIFYLGCQLVTQSDIKMIMEIIKRYGCRFRYAYTVELFSKTCNLNKSKNKSINQVLDELFIIRDSGVINLQFTYMPGLENLEEFIRVAPKFAGLASPHMSIFRPANKSQSKLKARDFINDPVSYLCEMRSIVENLWGGPILGNNLGNLWPFPLDQIHRKFSQFN
jgi:hypothetical protein